MRFLPEAKRIFRKHGVPEDLVYISLAESGLQNLTSPVGAKGYWQFLESTAKLYGLEVNREVDERMHFAKSTDAAARLLKANHEKFNSWSLALAAYNRGPDGLSRAMAKQKADSYYDLWLNTETSRYVFRVLALKLIMQSPQRYGFRIQKADLYPAIEVREIEVDNSIPDLVAFAQKEGSTLRVLRELNPWLKSYSLTVDKNRYTIVLPKDNDLAYPESWHQQDKEYIDQVPPTPDHE